MRSFLVIVLISFSLASAAAQLPKTPQLGSEGPGSSPRANSINEILVRQDSVWFGTGKGLSVTMNGGISWTNSFNTSSFGNNGISAIAINNDIIWAAIGYDSTINGSSLPTGGGLHYSIDRGLHWSFIPQPKEKEKSTVDTLLYGDNKIPALNVTVTPQNITYDIALTKKAVWIASWAGGLRKSTDRGTTWTRVILPPDNLDSINTAMSLNFAFELSPVLKIFTINDSIDTLAENDNHKVFSVYAGDDSTIWVGTAGGINKSTDGGSSWRKFSHKNQDHPISGNFVVALKEQRWRTRRIMWAATVNATDPDEIKGVSYSEDAGETWKTTLLGEWAHNIAVNDSGNIVYVATDNGLFRSSDFGESWIKSGSVYDPVNLQRFVSSECYAADSKGDTVWFGGPEGIAYTIDAPSQTFGSSWHIFRTAEQVGNDNRTYAFPNPFAPDDEPVRLHYRVPPGSAGTQEISIHIFDYAMLPVRTLIQKAFRLSGKEYDEIWNGRNDNRSIVANGVYFYRVEIGEQPPVWGKILVLR